MWCPNCGAYVTSGDFCDRCGASVPATSVAPPRGPTKRHITFGKRPAKEKRSGTLGDLFKSDTPFTGQQPAQKPSRSRGQTFLAWRDTRRAGPAAAAPPKPVRMPPNTPMPPRPPRQPLPPQQQPPDWASQPPNYQPGDQRQPTTPDPWDDTYGPLENRGAATETPPAGDPWALNRAANRDWNVLPQSGPPSGPLSGSSSGWRGRSPMVDLVEQEPEWMSMPHYGQDGAPVQRSVQARRVAANISRGVMNILLFGLILVILAIPISIGLSHLASLQAQSTSVSQVSGTPVPTAPVPNGFTGYATALYSLAYPSGWKHSGADQMLSDGTAAHKDSFTDEHGITATLYTTIGTANLLQSYRDELASDTAANAPLKAITQGAAPTYNRAKWTESDYTFSGIVNGKAAIVQMRILAVIQGATAYFIVLTAPQPSFGQINSTDFGPLLDTFRFY